MTYTYTRVELPPIASSGVLPHRDQKAYDLGARSAREVIDHLRADLEMRVAVEEILSRSIDRMHEEHKADLETIRNQNSHMAWLEGQLQEGAARERAYVEAINDLCDEVVRIHAKAKAVLEGRPDPAAGDENSVCTCPGGPPTPGGDFDLHVDGCPRPCRWEIAR